MFTIKDNGEKIKKTYYSTKIFEISVIPNSITTVIGKSKHYTKSWILRVSLNKHLETPAFWLGFLFYTV